MAQVGGFAFVALMAVFAAGCTQAPGQGGGQAGSGLQAPVVPPGMTAAQAGAYCSRLAQMYGEYVASVGGYLGGVPAGGEGPDLDTRVAIANCQDGNYAAGIPVLQRKLRDARVAVPPPPNAG
jgi:hypothetical protein